ncbi:hypothetical protein OG455_27880 [Kitasatospora sp. NBC_01287]|uniref:hypothetical protein n=1 Tax=Kitasatospora sp. NBC_01287 TaxID=2903573 RepID=UPI0022509EF2|nr:hypothetical protein [Kitasatospora sp. NBC_01287]MCX4749282.1 hypothetical protein [Kitasatospora sp. NBC_01287]
MIITASTLDSAVTRLAELLGTYTPNPQLEDNRGTLRLTNPDGYTLGARARVDGTTLQLWITAPGAKAEKIPRGLQPLQPGRSYHTVLHLIGLDGDLAETIHTAAADRLLPAILAKPRRIGHRPWEQQTETTEQPDAIPDDTEPAEDPAEAEPTPTDTELTGDEPAPVDAEPYEAPTVAEPVSEPTSADPNEKPDDTDPDPTSTEPTAAEPSPADTQHAGTSAPGAQLQDQRAPKAARPTRKHTAATTPAAPTGARPTRVRKTATPPADTKPTRKRTTAKKATTPTDTKPTRARKTATPAKPRTRRATNTETA